MFKEYKKELLLAIVLVAALFWVADVFGDALVPVQDGLTISAEIMVLGLAVLILPALIGTIPSGFLIAKKGGDVKAALFVPAVGAAVGIALLMLLSGVSLFFMTDADWQLQLNEVEDFGIDFFSEMSLADFKSMVISSVFIGAIFMAVFNFALGLAGGFIGKTIASRK